MGMGRGQRTKKGRTERRGIHIIMSAKLNAPSIKGITGKRLQFRGEERTRKRENEITNEPRTACVS